MSMQAKRLGRGIWLWALLSLGGVACGSSEDGSLPGSLENANESAAEACTWERVAAAESGEPSPLSGTGCEVVLLHANASSTGAPYAFDLVSIVNRYTNRVSFQIDFASTVEDAVSEQSGLRPEAQLPLVITEHSAGRLEGDGTRLPDVTIGVMPVPETQFQGGESVLPYVCMGSRWDEDEVRVSDPQGTFTLTITELSYSDGELAGIHGTLESVCPAAEKRAGQAFFAEAVGSVELTVSF